MTETVAELAQGFAGALAGGSNGVWVAWAACETGEPSLFGPVDLAATTLTGRNWPLRPGVGVDAWRRQPSAQFALYLAHLSSSAGDAVPRRLAQSRFSIQGPVLTARGDEAPWVVWAERRDREYAIVAHREGRALNVVTSQQPLLLPAAAMDARGRLWIAWQAWDRPENRGFTVRVRCLGTDGSAAPGSPAQLVSEPGRSSWSPAVVADADGGIWCAWDTWDGVAYRVMLRHANADGRWEDPQALSASAGSDAGFDLAPSLALDPLERVWVAWEHSNRWGRLNHRFWHLRTVHVQVVDSQSRALALPVGYDEMGALPIPIAVVEDPREEEFLVPVAPRVLASEHGVRVVYRRLQAAGSMGFGWDVRALTHTGTGWTAPERLSTGAGFPDTPFGVAEDRQGHLWLSYHACEYGEPVHGGDVPPHPPQRVVHCKQGVANERLVVESVAPAGRPTAPAAIRLRPLVVPPRQRDEQQPVPVDRLLDAGSEQYHLLFGDLHRHSLHSKCLAANDGAVLDHWRWAVDVGALDFYALTEHLEYMSYGEWKRGEDFATLMNGHPLVLPLYGLELAIPPGHANFFYLDQAIGEELRVACLSSHHLTEVWEKMDAWLPRGSVLVARHHQGHRQPDVARTFAARYEPVMEVVQIRGEYREWVERFLQQGCRVGFVGASDHAYAPAFPFGITGVWATEPTRAGVFDALWRRRTFATNGPKMRVFFSAAGVMMGEEGVAAGAPELRVEVEGTTRVQRVELFRNGRLLHVAPLEARRGVVTFRDETAGRGETQYYYARVLQERESGERRPHYGVAYSSPVWLDVA